MWTILLAGVGGGWYGTELFEYARSSFVDGYAVEHVPAGCAQADSEYKNIPPGLFSSVHSNFHIQILFSKSYANEFHGACLPF